MATRKPAKTSAAAKKAVAKKTTAGKPASRSVPKASKAPAGKAPTATSRKSTSKKVAKKAAPQKPTVKGKVAGKPIKAVTKKTAAKKTTRKLTAGKAIAGKPAAKKVVAKKVAVKKLVAKKVAKQLPKPAPASARPAVKPSPAREKPGSRAEAKASTKPAAAARGRVPKQSTEPVATGVSKKSIAATGGKTPAKPSGSAKPARKPTQRQALAATRKLLEQKQAHDRELQPWQLLDPHQTHVPDAGFQSIEAADKAVELHAAESRMKAIQGSAGTQDRRNQGKRDNR